MPGDRVDNAESSPDGKRIMFSTPTGVYVVDGNSSPRELSGRRDVHSLWFATDGRLAYATSAGTTVLDGKRARRMESHDPTQMMRFEKGSARVLIAAGGEARAWDPKTEQQTLLASASRGDDLLGTDRYQGGVVLWTGRAGASSPHSIVRVLRVSKDGVATEVKRLDGESAAREVASGGAMLLASSVDQTPPARTQNVPPGGEVLASTPRGLLVRRARGLALVSPAGTVTSVLDEPVDAGLTRIAASAQSTRVLVCFRGGSEGARSHPGVLAIDLDAPAHPVELDIDNCWNRALWLSSDGERVVFSSYGAFASATNDLAVKSTREGGGRSRSLGEGYNEVVFDGHDGIAFVSHRGVRFVDAKHDELFETDGPVEGLHFAGAATLRFAVGREVLEWDAEKGTKRVLARLPETQQILAALAAGDGMLLATFE